MKLDLGSGPNPRQGYQPVDLRFGGQNVFGRLNFPDNSVEQIWASHILEHETHRRTVTVLEDWKRVLVPGGQLEVVVPNLGHDALVVAISELLGRDSVHLAEMIFAHQEYEYSFHKTAFTKKILHGCFQEAGFRSIQAKGACYKVKYGLNRKKYGISHMISLVKKPELYAVGVK